MIINNRGEEVGKRMVPENDLQIKKILWACPVIHCSVMYKKNSILKIGSYDVNMSRRQEDYELWIRAGFKKLVFANIQDFLIKYRVDIKKNPIDVGYNRAKIGYKAVKQFDPRLTSYIALLYPLIRALLPLKLANMIEKLLSNSRFDPRKAST